MQGLKKVKDWNRLGFLEISTEHYCKNIIWKDP